MKKAVLAFLVMAVLPLTALLAQSDPAYAPADQPAAQTQADPAQPAPVDPAAQPSTAPAPARADAVPDPDAMSNEANQDRALPATASHGPLILLMGILAIGMFLVLKVFRRRSVDVS